MNNEAQVREMFEVLARNPVPTRYDSGSARVASVRRQRRKWSAVGAAVLVGTVVAGSAVLFSPDETPSTRPVVLPTPQPFTLRGEWKVSALFDANGQSILTDALAAKLRVVFFLNKMTATTGCTYVRIGYRQHGPTAKGAVFGGKVDSALCRGGEPPWPTNRFSEVRHASESNGILYLRARNGQTVAELEPTAAPAAQGLAPGERYATSNYPRNEYGQTYGSDAYAETFAETPDLVAVMGFTAGRHGFMKKTDFWPILHPHFKTPGDAAAYNEEQRKHPPRAIPVYALDGKTQIDWFRYGIGGFEARDRNGNVTRTLPEGN